MYQIIWWHKDNPEKIEKGNPSKALDIQRAWCEYANKTYPDYHHEVRAVEMEQVAMTQPKPEFEIGDQVLVGSKQIKAVVLDRKLFDGIGWCYKTSDKPDRWRNRMLLDPVKPDSV